MYIYSNYFLWAEFVLFSFINRIFSIPVDQLINLYFTYIFISYFVFSFIFFSVVFKNSSVLFFPAVVLIFSGITFSSFGQYMLSPLYLLPLIFLSLYLFLNQKRIVYLAWIFFFLCVSGNHYLPHYLFIFIVLFILSWLFYYFVYYRKFPVISSKNLSPKFIFVLLIAAITLLPALYSYTELNHGYISPTRGNATLGEKNQGAQPSVGFPLQNYEFLVHIPSVDPYSATPENLRYNHSVYFLGYIAILFFLLSFLSRKNIFYWSCVASLIIMMYFAFSSQTLLWRWSKEHIWTFYIRHGYVFSQIICFLIIIISTFGFRSTVKNIKLRYGVIILAASLSFYACAKVANYENKKPHDLEPVVYPKTRSLYSQMIIPKPFDTTPIILKEAAATHPNDDFIFFRKKTFNDLLDKNPGLVVGNLFAFLRNNSKGNLEEIPVSYIVDNNPNRIEIKVNIPDTGYLIRKENFHRDWKARINGKEAPILIFANAFQAIQVQKGEAIIGFMFRSNYPIYFWLHVIFVFIGYIIFFYDLFRVKSLNEII